LVAFAGCNNGPSTDTSSLPPPVNASVSISSADPTQVAAASALGRIGATAVPALIDALSDNQAAVRAHACRALAYMGANAKEAVGKLTLALNDQDETVRIEAATALGQIGAAATPATPVLLRMLQGKSQ
jgi:hypothetical protein